MYLVIDVGGTFIKHCVMDRDAEIMEKNKVPTPGRFGNGLDNIQQGLDAFLDVIQGIYDDYKIKYDIQGIAISLPGQVDVDNGICYAGGALPYLDKAHVGELVSERCDGLKVALENDGKCASIVGDMAGKCKGL
ncbi:MAG: ROK family protein [Coprococcus sp.]